MINVATLYVLSAHTNSAGVQSTPVLFWLVAVWSVLFYFNQFHSVSFHSILFCAVVFHDYSIQLHSVLFYCMTTPRGACGYTAHGFCEDQHCQLPVDTVGRPAGSCAASMKPPDAKLSTMYADVAIDQHSLQTCLSLLEILQTRHNSLNSLDTLALTLQP